MAFNFTNVAKKASNESVIRRGRTKADKAKAPSILSAYTDGCTIIGAELSHTTEEDRQTHETVSKEFAVFIIAEEPDLYFNGGSCMTNIVRAWIEQFGGDVEAMNAELAKSGGVKVTFEFTRLQNGNNYTVVNVM